MAITHDYRFLLVANDHSQIANVYDLDLLQQLAPVIFPGGHYPRSIAVSSNAVLAAVRSVSPGRWAVRPAMDRTPSTGSISTR